MNFVAIGRAEKKLWRKFDFSENATASGVFAIFPDRIEVMLRKCIQIFSYTGIIFVQNCV